MAVCGVCTEGGNKQPIDLEILLSYLGEVSPDFKG
jgi:hypothetical protein